MEKIFEGAISCKALLEAGSRNCKKLYIDKKKNTKDTRYLAKIAKSKDCEVVFCSRDEINEIATGKTHGGVLLLAEEKQIPMCQDTGLPVIFVKLGNVEVENLRAGIEEGIENTAVNMLRKNMDIILL